MAVNRVAVNDAFRQTRTALHMLAEHILAAARYAEEGRIGLVMANAGITTPVFGRRRRVLAIRGGPLVRSDERHARRSEISTLRAAGEFVGVTPGAPASVYAPATPCDLDRPLVLDAEAEQAILDWYRTVGQALRRFSPDASATLWPEHFDLAIRIGDVNYGGLAGDDAITDPYVFVGPTGKPPAADPFWDQPFGAARTWAQVPDEDAIVAFFDEGRRRLSPVAVPEQTASPARSDGPVKPV